jgi:hypothetical protein
MRYWKFCKKKKKKIHQAFNLLKRCEVVVVTSQKCGKEKK